MLGAHQTSQLLASHLSPAILLHIRETHPALQLEAFVTNAVSNLLRHEADIAVRMVRPAQGFLVARKVCEGALGTYASETYLARHGEPQDAEDLRNHDLLGQDADGDVLRGLAAFGLRLSGEAFAVRRDGHTLSWQLVRAGLGVGFVSHYVAATDPGVIRVLPSLLAPPLSTWLAMHREIRGSTAIRAVYDLLGIV